MNEKARTALTNANIQEKSGLLWNIADTIRGLYKPHEYGEVILPFTVIKRFHDTLLPTRQAVLDELEKRKNISMKDSFLRRASGYVFYNTSPYTFDMLLADSEKIEENFRAYLSGFSENVQDVLSNFDVDVHVTKLAKNGKLFQVIQEFNKQTGYLGADKISSTSEIDNSCNQKTYYKSSTSCDKPTTNNRKNTCYSVNSTFTSPGTVS